MHVAKVSAWVSLALVLVGTIGTGLGRNERRVLGARVTRSEGMRSSGVGVLTIAVASILIRLSCIDMIVNRGDVQARGQERDRSDGILSI